MKLLIRYILFISITALVVIGCADLQKDVPASAPALTVHKDGIKDVNSPNFHGNLIKQNNWSMTDCIQCHAADFKGGITGKSCYKCHTQPAGPVECNTCHGDFSDPVRIAPPRDTNGNTKQTERGVGVHTNHLYTNSLSVVSCSNCHVVPSSYNDPGHIDPLPAEVQLSGLATTNIAKNAKYDPATLTCSNTYCHGNFEFKKSDAQSDYQFIYTTDKMTGKNVTVIWTNPDTTQAACGTCHGLPPEGHIVVPLSSCFYCHQGVVDQDGNIIDRSKHINGYKSVRNSATKMQEFLKANQ